MAYGLQTWNSAGVILVDTSDRLTRYIGHWRWTIPVGSVSIAIAMPGAENGSWFCYAVGDNQANTFQQMQTNQVLVSRTNSFGTGTAISGSLWVFRC